MLLCVCVKVGIAFQLEPFHEHVFLERHLDGWCPPRGPVRNFMELVCIGLQRNPYITVEKKREHLEWFRSYFLDPDRHDILKLSGAIEMEGGEGEHESQQQQS